MAIKLYGSPTSTCTRRVATVLHEKKVSFDFVPIDLAKNEHKSPEFMAIQPFGQVPVLVRLAIVVFTSHAPSYAHFLTLTPV